MMLDLFGEETLSGSDAVISECGLYRYRLSRKWRADPDCVFVMLNPSTADAAQDDPTIRKCIGYSKAWGYGGLVVVNLFAYRDTDPDAMKRYKVPVGPDNDRHLLEVTREAPLVVCAWGKGGAHQGRGREVEKLLTEGGVRLHALELNGDGSPKHPLYLAGDLKPFLWKELE